MYTPNPDTVQHARFPTPDFHQVCHAPKGSGKGQKVSFRFLFDIRKEHRFNNHHSIMTRCRFANRSRFIEISKNALFREIPPRAPIFPNLSGGRGRPGPARPRPRPRPRPGPAFFRCAMAETPAVRRNAPVSSAANLHNVLANYNQPSSEV